MLIALDLIDKVTFCNDNNTLLHYMPIHIL